MAKKKLSKKQRQKRRKELMKAQSKSYRGMTTRSEEESVVQSKSDKETKVKSKVESSAHKLPITQIKKDLLRIILFAVFSILFLVFLKIGNIDFNAVRSFLRF